MHLPPPPLLAFSESKELSPVPAGFTAGGYLQPPLSLLPAVLLLGNTRNNARNSSSGRDPRCEDMAQTYYDRTMEEPGKHGALRFAFYSKGLEAAEVCGISLDQTATSKNVRSSQKEKSNNPTVCFSVIFLLPIR